MATQAFQALSRLGDREGTQLVMSRQARELRVVRHEMELTVTVPESVLEWFVDVKNLQTGSACSDWADYLGYDDSSVAKSDQEMCDDVKSFVNQLLERDLRYVQDSSSRSGRLEWLVGAEWQQAVPFTERASGGSKTP